MNPHDFAAYVKGWEYIITILFVLAFLGFWSFLNRRHPEEQIVPAGRATTGSRQE